MLYENAIVEVTGLMQVEVNANELMFFKQLSEEQKIRYMLKNGELNIQELDVEKKGSIDEPFYTVGVNKPRFTFKI